MPTSMLVIIRIDEENHLDEPGNKMCLLISPTPRQASLYASEHVDVQGDAGTDLRPMGVHLPAAGPISVRF